MDEFNGNFEGMENKVKNTRRFSRTIKVVIIGLLVLLLMIPMLMIENLVSERGRTQDDAIGEVSQKWSYPQTITGPYLSLQYPIITSDGKTSTAILMLFPDELFIDGQLHTEILKRGIYEVNVYQSELLIKGAFSSIELLKSGIDMNILQFNKAAICMNLSDMRGIGEQISIQLNDSVYLFEPGMDSRGLKNVGVHAIADLTALKEGKKLPYEMKVKLKGSQSMFFTPLGKTTHVRMKGNWNTPSFSGNYLPEDRTINDKDFSAEWQVLDLNRNYSQVIVNYQNADSEDVDNSNFGVNLKAPVEQYQQSMRSAKYAILIILLTFTVIFFTETMDKTRIHALQYLLVGLALCLFYSLLLSMSEHIGFNLSYFISSLLTISLVGGYMLGIIKRKRPALVMSGLLSVLYIYIFVLIQLETFALLAGSLGLFVILAFVMYFSKKIDWFND